jgi:hypothetical protein
MSFGFHYCGFGFQIHPTFTRLALGFFVVALSMGNLENIVWQLNATVNDLSIQNFTYQQIIEDKMKADLKEDDKFIQ